jgi:hypothetical protein
LNLKREKLIERFEEPCILQLLYYPCYHFLTDKLFVPAMEKLQKRDIFSEIPITPDLLMRIMVIGFDSGFQ